MQVAAPSASLDRPGIVARSRPVTATLARHWPLLVVLGAFVASAFVVPTLAPVGIVDDPIYARSAEILLRQGRLEILPITAETLVFQAVWGALFLRIFGDSLGVLRVATVTLVGVSGIAFYSLCLRLDLGRFRSALGTTLYLFNPLAYVLGFTFMSDSYSVALMVIALALSTRGLRDEEIAGGWLVAGSAVAACAFLVRQHGALIPIGIVLYLLLARRIPRDRAGARLVVQIGGIPLLTVVGYYLWFNFLYTGPANFVQEGFTQSMGQAGITGIGTVAAKLGYVQIMYLGLFALPLTIAVIPRLRRVVTSLPRFGWWAGGATAVIIAIGKLTLRKPFKRLPYIPQFLNSTGLGPYADLRGGRMPLVSQRTLSLITIVCAMSAVLLVVVWFRAAKAPRPARADLAGLIAVLLVLQALAVVPTSMYLRDTALSLDRYLLPLVPLMIVLTLWALRDVGFSMPLAWIGTIAFALVAVAGTHDFLSYQSTAWKVAADAHAAGVPYREIDGGGPWGAYHLWEYSYHRKVKGVSLAELKRLGLTGPILLSRNDVANWWTGFYAPATTPDAYVVSAEPLNGFTPVRRVGYSSWLSPEPTSIYLLRHPDHHGPP